MGHESRDLAQGAELTGSPGDASSGDGDDPLYFLHIPKTAGTSFISILHQRFPAEVICPACLWSDLLRIPTEHRATYRLYRGHFYAYLGPFLGRRLRHVTFLRDPIERSLSHYAHVVREPPHYFHARAREQGDLLTFLRDPATNPLISNFQTRSLALSLDPSAFAETLAPAEIDAFGLERALETTMPASLSDAELLARAKAMIDECVAVGLVEHFRESVGAIARRLRWPDVSADPRLNIAPGRPGRDALDPETLALLREQTSLDRELYDYARARLARDLVAPAG
jgi:hypothetical protein